MGNFNNSFETTAERQILQWLSGEITSYFKVRRYFASFDLGINFLLRGELAFFAEKLKRGGKLQLDHHSGGAEVPTESNSVALVVTFNPDSEVLFNIRRLREQFSRVIIVDNSALHNAEFFLPFNSDAAFTLLHHGNKMGLAGALNLGIRKIHSSLNSGWIFFFDQDSEVYPNFLNEIQLVLDPINASSRANTLYGVNYDDGKTISLNSPKSSLINVLTVITSGSFMRIENFRRVGLYIDEMFIDSLDHEYCLRARRCGMKIQKIQTCLMKHSLGDMELKDFLWRSPLVTNHPAFRWYYFTRNLIFTSLEGFPWNLTWVLGHSFSLFKNYIKALLFEQQKWKKSLAVIRGFGSGISLCFGTDKRY